MKHDTPPQIEMQTLITRLASHQRMLCYLIDPHIRGKEKKSIHPRIGDGIHVILCQFARDVEALQEMVREKVDSR